MKEPKKSKWTSGEYEVSYNFQHDLYIITEIKTGKWWSVSSTESKMLEKYPED